MTVKKILFLTFTLNFVSFMRKCDSNVDHKSTLERVN